MEVWVFDRKVNNRNVWFFIIDDCNDEISLLYLLLLVISIIVHYGFGNIFDCKIITSKTNGIFFKYGKNIFPSNCSANFFSNFYNSLFYLVKLIILFIWISSKMINLQGRRRTQFSSKPL